MLCRPSLCRYFATVLLYRMLCRSRRVGWGSPRAYALPLWLVDRVDTLLPLLRRGPLHP
jgi:hypothetical protein